MALGGHFGPGCRAKFSSHATVNDLISAAKELFWLASWLDKGWPLLSPPWAMPGTNWHGYRDKYGAPWNLEGQYIFRDLPCVQFHQLFGLLVLLLRFQFQGVWIQRQNELVLTGIAVSEKACSFFHGGHRIPYSCDSKNHRLLQRCLLTDERRRVAKLKVVATCAARWPPRCCHFVNFPFSFLCLINILKQILY